MMKLTEREIVVLEKIREGKNQAAIIIEMGIHRSSIVRTYARLVKVGAIKQLLHGIYRVIDTDYEEAPAKLEDAEEMKELAMQIFELFELPLFFRLKEYGKVHQPTKHKVLDGIRAQGLTKEYALVFFSERVKDMKEQIAEQMEQEVAG